MVSIDLKKEVAALETAYACHHDSLGTVREQFVKNVLVRINRELDGNFNPDAFRRQASYNANKGRIEVNLTSLQKQQATIAAIPLTVAFEKGEMIRIHNAHKYSLQEIQELTHKAGLSVQQQWIDDSGCGIFQLGIG